METVRSIASDYLLPFAVNLAVAAGIFVVGRWVARAVVRAVDRVLEPRVEPALRKFLCDLCYALFVTMVVIAALERVGVETTAAIAVLGAAGLAVGFALQGSLGHFAAGVMIMLFKPYRVGDVVSVAGHTGKVDAIQIFNTVLVTGDNRQILVPNGEIVGGTIENLTVRGTRRIDLVFGVGYDDDLQKVREILLRVVTSDPRVLADPAPQIAVAELADSAVNWVCRPWVNADDYWSVRFDLVERVKAEFDAAGISFPYPQRDVHIHPAAGAQAAAC
ncbi:MAG: mechanosensitive ion channel family protein [Deltaproteobacteria bacterium]|nr:MAG: mechanosensitive ion channel family protein [Deltaproteobacteria bacterium]